MSSNESVNVDLYNRGWNFLNKKTYEVGTYACLLVLLLSYVKEDFFFIFAKEFHSSV